MKVKILNKLSMACAIGVILTLLFAVPSFAGLGKIAGTVTDAETGDPLPGASVQIEGTMMGASTDALGRYFILNIPPGKYDVKVSYMGYATQEFAGVRAQLDVTTEINVKMKPTVIEGETVSVVAERPAIDKTMTATKVTFSEEIIDNILPVHDLNQVLQSSVTTQSMRGANKSGVSYMLDGVNITDAYWSTGGGSIGYTNVKHNDTPTMSTTGQMDQPREDVILANGRVSGMVETVGQVAQSMTQEVDVIAGTFNAEYAASGGVVNLATKSGGSKYSAKLFVRSSLGGLSHAGPDCYNAQPPEGVFGDMSAAEHYEAHRKKLESDPEATNQERAKLLDWTADKYEYGDDPRMNVELSAGGPLTSKGNFFFSGILLNDHGRFPGEFQRKLTASLKVNYDLTSSDRLTAMGKIDDGGKLLGWKNRQYTYIHQFFLEGQPVNEKLGIVGYLKHNHVFNPSSFLETTLSLVSNNRTYGYCPVNDKLQYDNYGDDFLILDTKDKVEKYMLNDATRIFNMDPGNDTNHNIFDVFGNQIIFGIPGYNYEDIKTSTLTAQTNFTKQLSFHHQLKAGAEYVYNTFDNFQHASSVQGYDDEFPFETVIWKINPWSFGTYIQDRIEYEGIIVNLGLRFDGYNMGAEFPESIFDPVAHDTLANGQRLLATKKEKKAETQTYFSPRIGVSHPITENAAMHYSWGMYTTRPNYGYWLFNYGVFSNPSLPQYRYDDPDPETATAYEIGINMAFAEDYGADLTAYYRDTRNASAVGYTVNVAPGNDFGSMTYIQSWGYRDSRGIELNLWKRPTAEMYFGLIGISGNLSVSFAYDKASSNASGLVVDKSANNTLYAGQHEDYDWDQRYTWPTYSRTYDDWSGKLTLLFDFPFEVKLATMATYRSPWRYTKTLEVTNTRYEEKLDGEYFLRMDLRLIKYVSFGNYTAGLFVEALNVLDRENIFTYDTHNKNTYYEEDKGPYGPLYRPANQYGVPYAGIARELYAGLEFSF